VSKIAFLFPGQGSQTVGMLSDLAGRFPEITATFEEASSVLGRDLWKISQEGPEEELNRTRNTQPAMLAADVALWRCWRSLGRPLPHLVAGHSLGEYAALVAAGALRFEDAVWLVERRARYMQEAVPEGSGAMTAILGLTDEVVADLCRRATREGEIVVPANLNAPGQVVIAGHAGAVERAESLAREAGARRVVRLAVTVPSHSPLMEGAARRLAKELEAVDIRPPQIPLLHNLDVEPCSDPEAIRRKLVEQLFSPVRWTETIQKMVSLGVTRFYECGPGRVLTGLNRRIASGIATRPLAEPRSWEDG